MTFAPWIENMITGTTETPATYNPKQVYPPAPENISVSAESPTLEQLQATMAYWLDTAAEKIQQLKLIGEELGVKGERYPHSLWEPYHRYRVGEITLHYKTFRALCQKQVTNVTVGGDYWQIIVTEGGEKGFELIDGFKHVNFTAGKPNNHIHEPVLKRYQAEHNIYIPGEWENILLPQFYKAIEKINTRHAQQEAEERSKLIERMGLNRGV